MIWFKILGKLVVSFGVFYRGLKRCKYERCFYGRRRFCGGEERGGSCVLLFCLGIDDVVNFYWFGRRRGFVSKRVRNRVCSEGACARVVVARIVVVGVFCSESFFKKSKDVGCFW